MNVGKTHMFCSKNVHHNVAVEISRVSGFNLVADLGKYLGIPLHHNRVNSRTFQFLEEKLRNCLSKWRANFLSFVGRITLTKSVLNTIHVHYMQTNYLPNSVCEKIDKISRDFIWGFNNEGKGTHLISWDKLSRPKVEGEVGIRKAKLMNRALLMKIGWGLIARKDSRWVRMLRSKYGCGEDIVPKVQRRNQNSNLWLGVCKIWNKVLEVSNWSLGNGKKISFWKEGWLNKGMVLREVAKRPLSDIELNETVSNFTLTDGLGTWRSPDDIFRRTYSVKFLKLTCVEERMLLIL